MVCYFDHSAKQANIHEITPQSDYVKVHSNGDCAWDPRYELAVTQCDMDITWFPFDEQICSLVFASWLLEKYNIALTPYMSQHRYIKSDEWSLVGEYRFISRSRVRIGSYTNGSKYCYSTFVVLSA